MRRRRRNPDMGTVALVVVALGAVYYLLKMAPAAQESARQLAAASYETSHWTGSGAAQAPSGPGIIPGLQWTPA